MGVPKSFSEGVTPKSGPEGEAGVSYLGRDRKAKETTHVGAGGKGRCAPRSGGTVRWQGTEGCDRSGEQRLGRGAIAQGFRPHSAPGLEAKGSNSTQGSKKGTNLSPSPGFVNKLLLAQDPLVACG